MNESFYNAECFKEWYLERVRERVKNNPLILDWNNPKFIWK